MGLKISEHLSYSEIVCPCGCSYGLAPGEFSSRMRGMFERLRRELSAERGHDCPITITSGCRCKAHNKAIGGAPHSYHTQGMALDTLPPDSMSVEGWYDWLDKHVGDQGAVISYKDKDCVHIDCRGTRERIDGRRQ